MRIDNSIAKQIQPIEMNPDGSIQGAGLAAAVGVEAGVTTMHSTLMSKNSILAGMGAQGGLDAVRESAEALKENLSAISMKMDLGQLVKMDEDGIDINDLTPEEMVTVVEQIQIKLATWCDDFSLTGSHISTSDIEAVTGSAAMAAKVARSMNEAGLAPTKERVGEALKSLDTCEQMQEVSEDTKLYLLKNRMEPTIQNVYMASHSVTSAGTGRHALSDADWNALRPQVAEVLKGSPLAGDESMIERGRALLENDMEVSLENMTKLSELDAIDTTDTDFVLERMIATMIEGREASETYLTGQTLPWEEAAAAVYTLQSATSEQIMTWAVHSEDSVRSLDALSDIELLERNTPVEEENPAFLRAYRQVQEARLLMTLEAGRTLEKQGISINTMEISNLIDQLKQLEQESLSKSLGAEPGAAKSAGAEPGAAKNPGMEPGAAKNLAAEPGATAQSAGMEPGAAKNLGMESGAEIAADLSNGSSVVTLAEVDRVTEIGLAYESLKRAPHVVLGSVMVRQMSASVNALTQAAEGLADRVKRADAAYEALQTEVRTDLGDSLNKAVVHSAESVLPELGYEDNTENRRAMRILAFHQLEISAENMARVKNLDSSVNRLFRELTPEKTLRMIRKGIDPLNTDVDELADYLETEAPTSQKQERYSEFLYRLEHNQEITPDERAQYIGIYSLMHRMNEDGMRAVGGVMKQGSELTMGNLLTAYMSGHDRGTEYEVSDDMSERQVKDTVSFYRNLFHRVTRMDPETMRMAWGADGAISPESFVESLTDGQNPTSAQAVAADQVPTGMQAAADSQSPAGEQTQAAGQAPAGEQTQAAGQTTAGEQTQADSQSPASEQTPADEASVQHYAQLQQALASEPEVLQLLAQNTIAATPANLRGADRLLHEPEKVFEELSQTLPKESVNPVEALSEIMEDGDTLMGSYDKAQELVEEQLAQSTYQEENYTRYQNLRELSRAVNLMGMLAHRNHYTIPYERASGEQGVMNVKVIQNSDAPGRFGIHFQSETYGRVTIEGSLDETRVHAGLMSDHREGLAQLESAKAGIERTLSEHGYETNLHCSLVTSQPGLPNGQNATQSTNALLAVAKIFVKELTKNS